MTPKSAIEGKKHPAAPAAGQSAVKTRANASAAASSQVAKKTVKASLEVLTEDPRYELAREAAETALRRRARVQPCRKSSVRLTASAAEGCHVEKEDAQN